MGNIEVLNLHQGIILKLLWVNVCFVLFVFLAAPAYWKLMFLQCPCFLMTKTNPTFL